MKIVTLFFLLIIVSCSSSTKKNYKDYSHVGELTTRDYIDHLASLGADYLTSEDVKEIKLKADTVQFLEQVYDKIVSNNELLLSREYKPRFHIIANKNPYIFSLPEAQFFISNGLIEKYLKSEELFVAARAAEVLKSNRNIYEKKINGSLGFF